MNRRQFILGTAVVPVALVIPPIENLEFMRMYYNTDHNNLKYLYEYLMQGFKKEKGYYERTGITKLNYIQIGSEIIVTTEPNTIIDYFPTKKSIDKLQLNEDKLFYNHPFRFQYHRRIYKPDNMCWWIEVGYDMDNDHCYPRFSGKPKIPFKDIEDLWWFKNPLKEEYNENQEEREKNYQKNMIKNCRIEWGTLDYDEFVPYKVLVTQEIKDNSRLEFINMVNLYIDRKKIV